MSGFLFQGATLGDQKVSLRVQNGRIARISRTPLAPLGQEQVRQGGRITAPFAEPHVHLDAALLGARAPNKTGTLREGIANWSRLRALLTAEDVRARALETLEMYASHGTLRVRTHVDTGSLLAVETLVALKGEALERGIELQVVAFPQEGILRAPGRQAQWEAAVALGCDAVGGIPHFERTAEEGWQSVRMAFDLAEKHDLMVDFHCDETDDPSTRNLEVVCAETLDRGFGGTIHHSPSP